GRSCSREQARRRRGRSTRRRGRPRPGGSLPRSAAGARARRTSSARSNRGSIPGSWSGCPADRDRSKGPATPPLRRQRRGSRSWSFLRRRPSGWRTQLPLPRLLLSRFAFASRYAAIDVRAPCSPFLRQSVAESSQNARKCAARDLRLSVPVVELFEARDDADAPEVELVRAGVVRDVVRL